MKPLMILIFSTLAAPALCEQVSITALSADPTGIWPVWANDGTPGYDTRQQAIDWGRAAMAQTDVFANHTLWIVTDPDGGFTPVFVRPDLTPGLS